MFLAKLSLTGINKLFPVVKENFVSDIPAGGGGGHGKIANPFTM
jgi:hypothetical protein